MWRLRSDGSVGIVAPLALASALAVCSCTAGEAPADAGLDATIDAPPPPRTHEVLPPPSALTAGIAETVIPVPVGIGTMGFGAIGATPNPSPFVDIFPATTRAHGSLTFRAVALSRGPAHELVIVRMDTVGVFQQLREAVLDEVEARIGRRLDDSLVLAGNHTHSGPGRLLMASGVLTQLADTFLPEVYDRIVDALATAITEALADARPAELGWATAHTSAAHADRRCENDPLDQLQELGDLPLVAIRREGRLDAIVASYGYHGTVLGQIEHTLSGDMGSVVEQRIEERFDHPVLVLFLNSWGADMAPGNPPLDPGAVGAPQPGGYERMQALGDVVADAILPELASIVYSADHAVRARTYHVPIDRDWIAYEADVFLYANGGAFCGLGADGNCATVMPNPRLDRSCIRLSATDGLPHQTLMTAGQLGDLYFVTAPGEWSTALANGVLDRVREASGSADVMFIGYANDYTGYSVGEADWWQGGYEASGALWGPRQGDYLAGRLFESFESFFDLWVEPPWLEPDAVPAFSGYTYDPYVPEGALGAGTMVTDVAAAYGPTDVVTFTLLGSDPWLGTPLAILERDDGTGSFAPVLRPSGAPVDSTAYDTWIDLSVDPPYADVPRATERTFSWSVHYPVASRAGSAVTLDGTYRFRVSVPADGGEREVISAPFVVTP